MSPIGAFNVAAFDIQSVPASNNHVCALTMIYFRTGFRSCGISLFHKIELHEILITCSCMMINVMQRTDDSMR